MAHRDHAGANAAHDTSFVVPSVESLRALETLALPLGLSSGDITTVVLRDVYLDTLDRRLESRGVRARFRVRSDDTRQLSLFLSEAVPAGARNRVDSNVDDVDPVRAAAGSSQAARELQALVDVGALAVMYTVYTERHLRRTSRGWLGGSQFEFAYDSATVERNGISRAFQELTVRRLHAGAPTLADIAAEISERHGLRPTIASRLEQERALASAIEREADRRGVSTGRAVVLVALDRGTIACRSEGSFRLPSALGTGMAACQHLMLSTFGSSVGELRLLGELPAHDGRPHLEVWLVLHGRYSGRAANAQPISWLSLDDLIARAGTASLSDPLTIAALLLAARSDLSTLTRAAGAKPAAQHQAPSAPSVREPDDEHAGDNERLLDGDQSLLEFNSRVLSMAEDARVPLLERLQYLSIVSANNDEFFAVRYAALQRQRAGITAERERVDTESRAAELGARVRSLSTRQERCLRDCMTELSLHGIRVASWADLSRDDASRLRDYFRRVVFPALTPQAVTEAPGYPRPQVASFVLSLAVMVKDPDTGPVHLTFVRVPAALPRLMPLDDHGTYVLLEDLIRDGVDALYPGRSVLQAFAFRVTRSGELEGDDDSSADLLQVIEEDTKRRWGNAVVRVEVEKAMPASLRTALVDELRFEGTEELLPLGTADVYESDGPLDLTVLRELASLQIPALRFAPVQPRIPFHPERSTFAIVSERDRLVHHPYDAFSGSVQRFIEEAADDPAVTTIKMTLYRAGERSPIVEALMRAAASGKDVAAFVELKARFDEERNVRWAQQLRGSGVHVVHGVAGLKTHAKLALVARREGDVLRRYVHVGTGNYNAGTARVYTDLGLFSADEALASEVSDLFNELTGSSGHPRGAYRRLLVAPHTLLPQLLKLIDREIQHARDGKPAGIRVKVNGLSDSEIVEALYRASNAGVTVDAIVRGVCRLRPGVEGLSEHARVRSILGRFLEHARIYRFENGGDPEYFIGSADWRPRNLRRRVEVVASITDLECRTRLDAILDRELADPSAWELAANGSYYRPSGVIDTRATAQTIFAVEAGLNAPVDLAPA
jgi:polyphosphate kinase